MRPADDAVFPGKRQAAFGSFLHPFGADDFRIDRFDDAVAEIHDEHPAENPYLRRCQADPVGVMQRFPQIVEELCEFLVEFRHRTADFSESRVSILENIAQCHEANLPKG